MRCLHPQFPGQQALHQAALLLIEGGALGAEESEFGLGGVEDVGGFLLFFDGRARKGEFTEIGEVYCRA